MGEVAEMMLEGILCQSCGVYLDSEPTGYPVSCPDCQPLYHRKRDKKIKKLVKEINKDDKDFFGISGQLFEGDLQLLHNQLSGMEDKEWLEIIEKIGNKHLEFVKKFKE